MWIFLIISINDNQVIFPPLKFTLLKEKKKLRTCFLYLTIITFSILFHILLSAVLNDFITIPYKKS